jgi:hypothetical protein
MGSIAVSGQILLPAGYSPAEWNSKALHIVEIVGAYLRLAVN